VRLTDASALGGMSPINLVPLAGYGLAEVRQGRMDGEKRVRTSV
jgi:hypothetical protein